MSQSKYTLFMLTLLLLFVLQGAAQAHVSSYFWRGQEYKIEIPQQLTDQIRRKFGEFDIATRGDYCPQFSKLHNRVVGTRLWSYGALSEDFDQDGMQDYSFIIRTRESLRYIWVLAMRTTNQRNQYLLTDMGWPSIRHFNHTSHQFEGKVCEGAMVLDKAPDEGFGDSMTNLLGIEAHGRSLKVYWKEGELYELGQMPLEYVRWYYGDEE